MHEIARLSDATLMHMIEHLLCAAVQEYNMAEFFSLQRVECARALKQGGLTATVAKVYRRLALLYYDQQAVCERRSFASKDMLRRALGELTRRGVRVNPVLESEVIEVLYG